MTHIVTLYKRVPPGLQPTLEEALLHNDLGTGSKLKNLRNWSDKICFYGPLLSYYPKASECWLRVKAKKEEEAKQIFAETGIQITTEGRK